ncbi:MAG: hypothetical protein PHI12_12970 [Dehalococcoidales bacterium]|nr:hypothetical protein [Dehalococcoidales bacterium]
MSRDEDFWKVIKNQPKWEDLPELPGDWRFVFMSVLPMLSSSPPYYYCHIVAVRGERSALDSVVQALAKTLEEAVWDIRSQIEWRER